MSNEIKLFEQQNMMAFIELRDLSKKADEIKARYEEVRDMLAKGMEEYGIKKIDNEYVAITYVAPTPDGVKLDEKTWRAEDPKGYNKVFEKYNKRASGRKGYVKVTAK